VDSNLTKKRMADAFKKLMTRKQFSAISISDICDECGMHRKSFYYHFKDKYELVSWIYDDEVRHRVYDKGADKTAVKMYILIEYMYDNKEFYARLLEVEGQNSFREYFRGKIHSAVTAEIQTAFKGEGTDEYRTDFITEAVTAIFIQWIKSKEPLQPENFINQINNCFYITYKLCSNIISAEEPEKTV